MNVNTAAQWDVFGVLFLDDALPKFIYDQASLRILQANNAAARIYGYQRVDFGDMTILDLHVPDHVADIVRLVRRNPKDERRHKSVHVTRTGALLDVDIFSQPIEYDGVAARLATVIDVTVRERAQHALADAETLLQGIIDSVAEPIFIKDLRGRYLFMNRAGATMQGLFPEDVIGKTAAEVTGAAAAAPFSDHDAEVLRLAKPSTQVVEATAFGSRRTWYMSKAPWIDADGNVRGIIGNARDITEQQRSTEQLQAAERKYRGLFERMTPGVIYLDRNGAITAANPAAQSILRVPFGLMQGQFIISAGWRVLRSDGSDFPVDEFPAMVALRTGEPVTDVVMGVYDPADADVRWISLNAVPEFDDDVAFPSSVFVTFHDITELRRAEEELRASRERLQIVIDQLPAVLWTTDRELRITTCEGAGSAALGLQSQELVGRTIMAVSMGGSESEYWHRAALQGQSCTFDLKLGGRVLRTALEPLRDRNGRISGVLGVGLDITEQAAADERFQALVANSREISLIVDRSGRPLFSSSAVRILGFTGEEMSALRHVFELVHPDDRPIATDVYKRVQAAPGTVIDYELRIRHRDGSWRVMECAARNLLHDPVINGVVLNVRDITERRATETRLHASEEQLRQAQKLEAVGRLAGGIAHDFNNVLTAITGHADMLREMFSEHDPRRRDLEEIRRAAERATSLTRQLLTFSRSQVLEPAVIDMRAVVRDLLKMLERLLGEDIQLETRVPDSSEVPAVNADRTSIEQVIMNLAVNARDAMPAGGKLSIDVGIIETCDSGGTVNGAMPAGRYVKLSVIDTGDGIPPELLANIFEPFFTTKERGRGTGLGLSTVYGIVQQSGGYLCVHSEPGYGTTFEVLLPLVAAEAASEAVVIPDNSAVPDGSETVLLVEDDASVRSMAERILRRRGYHVLTAENGVIGLEVAGRAPIIDLIITDLVMPQMSGREFACHVARLHEDARVLFMSGYTYEEVAEEGGPESDANFLSKPFSPDALARKARAVLDAA